MPGNHQIRRIANPGRAFATAGGKSSQGVVQSLAYATDWGYTTGTGDDAILDGPSGSRKWDVSDSATTPTAQSGGTDRVAVISTTGLDFPSGMPNCLAIRYHTAGWLNEEPPGSGNANADCGINMANKWDLPEINGVLCRRMYFRHNISGTESTTHHPVQSANSAGTCAFAAEWVMAKGDTFVFQIATLNSGAGGPTAHRWCVTLTRGVTYRVEERYERTGTTTWRLHARIYDSSNTQLFGDSDFVCNNGGHDGHPNPHSLSNGLTISTPTESCMRQFMIINQGVGFSSVLGSNDINANRIYYGGFAVSLSDWCGPYTAGEAD